MNMKKILSLIGATTLALSGSVTGAILLKSPILTRQVENSETNGEDNSPSDKDKKEEKNDSDSYISPFEIIKKILTDINNSMLTNNSTVSFIENFLKDLKNYSPKIVEYLSFLKFSPSLALTINELAHDWDQQSDFGNSPIVAMKNFINTSKGDIAQAKRTGSKGQWHYVAVRAQYWNWNNFYQYMAGANMNYMMKILSQGNYIGDLINKHLHLGPFTWGFDKDDFVSDISHALQQLPTTKAAWPYLIKAIVPLVKIKVLNLEDPTLGFKNLTWTETTNEDLSMKLLLRELKHLLSAEGYNDLIAMFTSVLTGTFGEDIIIDASMLGYYTFPEMLELINSWPINKIVGDGLKAEVLAKLVVDEIFKITNKLDLGSIFTNMINWMDSVISKNLVVDLKTLSSDLNQLYRTDDFQNGLDQLIDFISNPKTTQYSLDEILKLWGVQKNKSDFKDGSAFFIIKKWINEPNSMLNQVLDNLIAADKKKHLIILSVF